MAKRSAADRLDLALEALLSGAGAPAGGGADIRPLLRLATGLHGLPRESFRSRLKRDLTRREKEPAKPAGRPEPGSVQETLTLYLTTARVDELVTFVKEAFGAVETLRARGSAGGTHVEARIRDSKVMFGGGAVLKPEDERPAGIHLYVEDADATYRRALEAGAVSLGAPRDQFYGDREAAVRDVAGNEWFIATHQGKSFVREGRRAVTPALHPRGAVECVRFLEEAFGARVVERHATPDGVLRYGVVEIGDSALELGEAHGPWQPLASALYLMVPDVDAAHRAALSAGAVSTLDPTDQPYGVRSGWVIDPFGHTWYLATPLAGGSR